MRGSSGRSSRSSLWTGFNSASWTDPYGCARPCDPAGRVPAVQAVRLDGDPDPVHRQSALTSSCAAEKCTHSTNCAENPLRSHSCCSRVDVAVNMQRQVPAVPGCLRSVHRQCLWRLLAAVKGLFFAVFTAFFGLLLMELGPGCLRTFFFEPSMVNSCWWCGTRGWRGRRGSDSQVFCHM